MGFPTPLASGYEPFHRCDSPKIPGFFNPIQGGGGPNQQCPAGTRTRPATRYFSRYPTRPDSVLEIIG